MALMRVKLKVSGDDRAELEAEAQLHAERFFGHDRFALVGWEVTPNETTPASEKFAEMLGLPYKKFRASVTASERRTRPLPPMEDEEEDDED